MRTIVRACVGVAAISACGLFYLAVCSTNASAQAQAKIAAEQRFQISAWGYAIGQHNTGSNSGAYILDTQSGRVWFVDSRSEPRDIGSVK